MKEFINSCSEHIRTAEKLNGQLQVAVREYELSQEINGQDHPRTKTALEKQEELAEQLEGHLHRAPRQLPF